VCRHWWRKGACAYGSDCRFAHPPHETLPPWPRRAYRQQTHNAGRVGIFRRWLVQTFGTAMSVGTGNVSAGCGARLSYSAAAAQWPVAWPPIIHAARIVLAPRYCCAVV
jgi:hypothetical protein